MKYTSAARNLTPKADSMNETIVSFMESAFGVKFLAADVYFISDLPADLRMPDVVRIGAIALILALASTVYPAWRGARTMPAEALRYE